MDDILWFVNCHLANSGMGDFEGQEDGVDVIFNRDMLMNESEIIDNCTKSQGLTSAFYWNLNNASSNRNRNISSQLVNAQISLETPRQKWRGVLINQCTEN